VRFVICNILAYYHGEKERGRMKLYGIPNCDTVKKARTYLEKKKINYEFVDFKSYTPTIDDLERWTKAFGDHPVNNKGLTYKKHKAEYEKLSPKAQLKFIQEHTSMIKRPILENKQKVLAFGFDATKYAELF
jgi:Spx/MgsR family transcriptional regulator